MITGIRQKTIVQEDGRIEVLSSDLPVGITVEVLVFIDSDEQNTIKSVCSPWTKRKDVVQTRQDAPLYQNGVPGKQLLRFAGSIQADDLEIMRSVIEEECERIDEHEW